MIPDVNGKMHLTDLHAYSGKRFFWENEIEFVLSTRNKRGKVIEMNENSIRRSTFNSNHPTRITIHGWNGDPTSDVNVKVIEEYLKQGDYNCIVVDWSDDAGR